MENKIMQDYPLGFIGAGRITKIMLEGLKRAGKLPQQIVVTDLNQDAPES
jgi:pyrroline-5-carboxylate reductase